MTFTTVGFIVKRGSGSVPVLEGGAAAGLTRWAWLIGAGSRFVSAVAAVGARGAAGRKRTGEQEPMRSADMMVPVSGAARPRAHQQHD